MAPVSPLIVEPATRAEAAQAFELCARLDPEGRATAAGIASEGLNLKMIGPEGEAIVNVDHQDGALWCFGAAGRSRGLTPAGLHTLEQIALRSGLGRIRFQTIRRGLVRQAQRAGFRVVDNIGQGVVMEKVIV